MLTTRAKPEPTLSCIRCGYDLRGIPASGNCPECGLSIAQSVRRDNLWHDRRWLRRLHWGALAMLAGLALLTLAALFGRPGDHPLHVAARLALPASLAAYAVAVLLLTDGRPWQRGDDWLPAGGAAVRGGAAVLIVLAALLRHQPLVLAVLWAAAAAAAMAYLAVVARRLFEVELASACRAVAWGMPCSVAVPLAAWATLGPGYTGVVVLAVTAGALGLLIAFLVTAMVFVELAVITHDEGP